MSESNQQILEAIGGLSQSLRCLQYTGAFILAGVIVLIALALRYIWRTDSNLRAAKNILLVAQANGELTSKAANATERVLENVRDDLKTVATVAAKAARETAEKVEAKAAESLVKVVEAVRSASGNPAN